MPATATGPDVVCEHDGVGVALELAALAAFVLLLRYAAVLYANHLLDTLIVVDDDDYEDLRAATGSDEDGGRRRASSGLDDADIARLPCFVSHGAVEEGETARALPWCTHAFHARCVEARGAATGWVLTARAVL